MLNLLQEKTKNVEANTIPLPRNIAVTQEGSDVLIQRKWSVYDGVKSLAGSGFVLVIIFYLFGAPLKQSLVNDFFSKETLALLFIFGIFFALGTYLLVLGIYQILNSTTIRLNTISISTHHQPLPWRKRTFSTPEIKQVFITEHDKGDLLGGSSSISRRENGKRVRHDYSVDLLLLDDKKAPLLQQLPRTQAYFIQQELERHLSIENRTVKSE